MNSNTWEKQSIPIEESSTTKKDLGLSRSKIAQSAKVPITSSPLTKFVAKISYFLDLDTVLLFCTL